MIGLGSAEDVGFEFNAQRDKYLNEVIDGEFPEWYKVNKNDEFYDDFIGRLLNLGILSYSIRVNETTGNFALLDTAGTIITPGRRVRPAYFTSEDPAKLYRNALELQGILTEVVDVSHPRRVLCGLYLPV